MKLLHQVYLFIKERKVKKLKSNSKAQEALVLWLTNPISSLFHCYFHSNFIPFNLKTFRSNRKIKCRVPALSLEKEWNWYIGGSSDHNLTADQSLYHLVWYWNMIRLRVSLFTHTSAYQGTLSMGVWTHVIMLAKSIRREGLDKNPKRKFPLTPLQVPSYSKHPTYTPYHPKSPYLTLTWASTKENQAW